MIHLGTIPADTTVYIPFSTYAGSTGASVTCSGFAVTDVEIYKNGSTTQRASDAGIALLDTDGIDFDGITGLHGFSIDLSDNTDAGFYAVGSFYWVVVSAITVDSQTVTFLAATFRIGPAEALSGHPKVDVGGWLGTAPATPTVAGVPEVDVTHLLGTAWLAPGTAGTPDVNAKLIGATAQTGRDIGASVLLSSGTGTGQLDFTSGVVKANLAQILGTALTETAGYLAAGFKKFFNVATPTSTMNQITLVDTTTTNSDMRGTDSAALATDMAKVPKSDGTVTFNATAVTGIQNGLATAAQATAIEADTQDLQTQIGAAGDGLTGIPKTGYKLASDGLDVIDATIPSAVATTFPGFIKQIWARFFYKSTLSSTELITYASDGTTVVTTQTASDNGTLQTQGKAS